MKCNWWRWAWGIIPLLILGWIAVEAEHTRLERDLAERASAALGAANLAWASSAFQGRDGVLSGRATDVADPDRALSILGNVWGVRLVDNKADLIEQVESYHWAAARKNNRVRLSGYVPNIAVKQTIMGVARASFPGFDIQDRMKLARGVPSGDIWLGGVSYALKQLTMLQRGEVRLDGLALTVGGEAEDASAYRSLRSSVSNGLPKGIKLASATFTPPEVSPHVWTARFDGRSMGFKGNVPSDMDAAYVIAAARERLSESAITDDAEPAAGAAQGWNQAAALSVRQLRRLENGQVEIRDGLVTLTGLAHDEDAASAIRQAFKNLPPAFKFADAMSVRPKPKAAEAPPADPVPTPPPQPGATPPPAATPPAPGKSVATAPPPAAPPAATPPVVTPPAAVPAPPKREPPPEAKTAVVPQANTPPAAPARPAAPAPAAPSQPPGPPPSAREVKAAKVCEDTLGQLATAGTLLFRYSSAEISQTSFETLDKLAAAAKQCPDTVIEIGGFASAEGSIYSNLRLSQSRAQSVLDYLVKAGVEARQLEAKGYGITRPTAPNDSAENMAKNRRIEFSVRPRPATP